MLKRLFARAAPRPRVHALPAGERVYAIGDIHGRLDLFEALLERIAADEAARGPAETTIVQLGDLVDRGPESRGVVARAMRLAEERATVFLAGNHEELFLRTCAGDRRSAGVFARVGGRATLLSYGVSEDEYDASDLGELAALAAERVPPEHVAFLAGFADHHVQGDYLFVHAGIRPGVPVEAQQTSDLRWIRRDFLDDPTDHGRMVVHGHTIVDAVDEQANRIGIDTGAFASGRLTALGLEGDERWYLAT